MDKDIIADLLTLEYHGPKVDLGRMDSYQVAASIIAFSDFLGVLTKNSFGDKIDLRTEIQGIRGESFDIDFFLQIFGYTATILSLSGSPLSMKDYFDLIKESIKTWIHLKGSSPKEIIRQTNNMLQIANQEGQLIYVNANVVNVVSDNKAGKAAEQFIRKPLESGVSQLLIKSSTVRDSTTIDSKDASFFKQIDIEKPLLTTEIKMGLQIESPTFKEGNKWRFFDGQNSFFADILDEDFLERVNIGVERFGKGDTLIALVRINQSTTLDTLKMERSVIKVVEHVIAPEQNKLKW